MSQPYHVTPDLSTLNKSLPRKRFREPLRCHRSLYPTNLVAAGSDERKEFEERVVFRAHLFATMSTLSGAFTAQTATGREHTGGRSIARCPAQSYRIAAAPITGMAFPASR
ncbi:hypothetical protein MTO96_035756 [Rhipicephalus appendiculatus]